MAAAFVDLHEQQKAINKTQQKDLERENERLKRKRYYDQKQVYHNIYFKPVLKFGNLSLTLNEKNGWINLRPIWMITSPKCANSKSYVFN